MNDDLVKRLRDRDEYAQSNGWDSGVFGQAADYIEQLQDTIARIQHTNLRRDMNVETRTIVIDRMCKEKRKDK